jgi:hypothetical protein
MTWRALDTAEAWQDFMDRFGWFHDACLRDASLATRTHIDADGAFHDDGGRDTTAVLFFQSQGAPERAIELRCSGVSLFKVAPTGENRDSMLTTAAFGPCPEGYRIGLYFIGLPVIAEPDSWAHRHVDPDTEPPAVEIVAASMAWRPVADAVGPVVRHQRLDD